MEKSTKWVIYLSGPMTGIPQFNYPAFKKATKELRDQGLEVIDPSEIDDSHTQKIALASTDGNAPMPWGQLIGRDIAVLCGGADEVALLPGWETSRGSMLEALAALCDDIVVTELPTRDRVPVSEIVVCLKALLEQREYNKNVHQAHKPSLLQARS